MGLKSTVGGAWVGHSGQTVGSGHSGHSVGSGHSGQIVGSGHSGQTVRVKCFRQYLWRFYMDVVIGFWDKIKILKLNNCTNWLIIIAN